MILPEEANGVWMASKATVPTITKLMSLKICRKGTGSFSSGQVQRNILARATV